MALAERIVDVSRRRNVPIREPFKPPVLMAAEKIVSQPGELSIQDRKTFVSLFIVLLNGTKMHGIRSGSITGLDSKGEQRWDVDASEADDFDKSRISLRDDEDTYSLDLEKPEVSLYITPHEEGIRAYTKPLTEDELRDWIRRSLEIYKNSKLPPSERWALFEKWSTRRKELGVIDYRVSH